MGKKTDMDSASLCTSIISTIQSSDNGKSMELKTLRSAVLPTIDKQSKKLFKTTIKSLEEDEKVSLNADGIVKLSKSERGSSDKKKKKKDKKRKRESKENDIGATDEDVDDKKKSKKKLEQDQDANENYQDQNTTQEEEKEDENDEEDQTANDNTEEIIDPKDKNKPCKNNPQGITRLFLGNLPFTVTEETLNSHLKETITHIKWITDKTTGKFYGSAFVEVRTSKDAAMCMKKLNGSQLMGRPLKLNYAPVREGEENDWPPRSRVITGGKMANSGGGGQAGGSGIKAMSVKPEGCAKLFIGNLSYEIDDEGITKFFMGVDAEVKSVRWLHHRDSGDFKGCGYVDFWNPEACEKAATLNGKNLLNRPIRIDWTE